MMEKITNKMFTICTYINLVILCENKLRYGVLLAVFECWVKELLMALENLSSVVASVEKTSWLLLLLPALFILTLVKVPL